MSDVDQDKIAPPDIKVQKLDFDIGQDCELYLLANGWSFIIKLSPNSFSTDLPEALYLKKLDAAQVAEDHEQLYSILLEIEDFLLKLSLPVVQCMVTGEQNPNTTLLSHLVPWITVLQIVEIEGKSCFEVSNAPPPAHAPGIDLEIISRTGIPIYRPSEITVLKDIYSKRVLQVSVDGEIYCCKLVQEGYPDLIRELQVLQDMFEEPGFELLRIPKLRGFIRSEATDELIGFVMDYIKCHQQLPNLGYAARAIKTIDQTRRVKWFMQVEDTVLTLHRKGMFWGDVKPENVLLDLNDDVWVIDFGGGRTDEWVSEALKDSMAGDLEGLCLMRKCLEV